MAQKNRNSEEDWRERIAAQEHSGISVKQFCEQQQITEQRFYVWRKRLRERGPVRFALLETGPGQRPAAEVGLELVLTGGERLRIGAGVDTALLRAVVEVLRG